jgi:hypothetical protein
MKPKKRHQDRLQVMVCLPCDQTPANERFKVVKVSDGDQTQIINFGRHQPISQIMKALPSIFMDRVYDERRSKKRAMG